MKEIIITEPWSGLMFFLYLVQVGDIHRLDTRLCPEQIHVHIAGCMKWAGKQVGLQIKRSLMSTQLSMSFL